MGYQEGGFKKRGVVILKATREASCTQESFGSKNDACAPPAVTHSCLGLSKGRTPSTWVSLCWDSRLCFSCKCSGTDKCNHTDSQNELVAAALLTFFFKSTVFFSPPYFHVWKSMENGN